MATAAKNRWDALSTLEQLKLTVELLERVPLHPDFRAGDALKVAEACVRSEWDVCPGDLTGEELCMALTGRIGALSRALTERYEGKGRPLSALEEIQQWPKAKKAAR